MALETAIEELPQDVRDLAKLYFLDGIGVLLAGSKEEAPALASRYAQKMGGHPVCSVFGLGYKTSPPMAAFINGISAHVLDYEPLMRPPTHATSPVLPAILAVCELMHRPGKEALVALVVGYEVQARLRYGAERLEQTHQDLHFHPPGVVGPIGAAACSARLLGLNLEQTQWALGMAASRGGGLIANIGTMCKSSHCGNAARMGVEAALLAAEGFTANEQAIEGERGWVKAYYQDHADEYDWGAAKTVCLPTYRMVSPGFVIKFYPARGDTHAVIELGLELRREHRLDASHISEVVLQCPANMPLRAISNRPRPSTGLEGKFSYQYCLAAALLDGHIRLDTFRDERRFRPDMELLLSKIRLDSHPESGVTVTVRMDDDRIFQASSDSPMIHLGKPVTLSSREAVLLKFRDIARRVMNTEQVERAIQLVDDLEHLADLDELFQMMVGTDRLRDCC
ncbi:MAG: MmgE/PrpD family protein [Chloroflexi bacterium]|nr:MmgE/PrpD family protein [Chloroflexota bacterium]